MTGTWSTAPLIALLSLAMCGPSIGGGPPPAREPIVGGPCEGCESVFERLPEEVPSSSRIAPTGEQGEPLVIQGRVTHRDGSPAPGTIIYAYHTDTEGIYPRDESLRGLAAYRHGRLRGWARADDNGKYRFETIRPGGYPGSDQPQHVHMHVIEPGRCTYYIDDIIFTDDPRLTPGLIEQYNHGRGGPGIVTPRDEEGVWFVERDIVLGERIPDYP